MNKMQSAFYGLLVAGAIGAFSFGVRAQLCNEGADCRQDTSEVDSISLELRLRWRSVGVVVLDATGRLQFPDAGVEPGIYRFELRRNDERVLYIGETENLVRRFNHYRSPGKTQKSGTNHRICLEMRRTLLSGGTVDVFVVSDDAWFCPQAACVKADLMSANQRKLLEQLAIFSVPPGLRVLNRERVKPPAKQAVAMKEFYVCS